MNKLPDITVKELVLIGGGHSHVGLLKMFAMNPLPGLRLTMLSSDIHTPYSGMLPGYIAGQYSFDDAHLDLRPLSEFARCRLYHTRVSHIDADQQLIYSDNRPPIRYDLLSINIGSTPDAFDIPGVKEFAIPVKPVDQFISHLETIIHRALTEEMFQRIVVVGGGASGVELILSIQQRIQSELKRQGKAPKTMQFILISAATTILPSHNNSVKKRVLKLFQQRGIALHLNSYIASIAIASSTSNISSASKDSSKYVSKKIVHCNNGSKYEADAVIWCTTASSAKWPKASGLAVDERGFIKVNDYLQSISHDNVFAAGDIAAMVNYPRPKSGVFAVRQGPPLFENMRRFISGQSLKAFKPQKRFLSLLNCADKTAIASRSMFAFQGHWVWQYKNWIDVRFMKLFSDLPAMNETHELEISQHMVDESALKRLQEIPMRCGGCGAKVGSTILTRVIDRLLERYKSKQQESVVLGLEQADDAAVIAVPEGKLLVQSLDYFKTFINDPYLLGKIAANHALGDLYAMGATPHSALALVTLPYSLADILEDELFQIMSGALEVMQENDMSLLGGHTGEGSEMAFGLNVNGFVSADEMMTKSGLQSDEVLILTKPLGTGTLLAANMRFKAKGRWIEEAIAHMLQSNRQAADIFKAFGARACTDITGFGLLGHLAEMLKASKLSAQIDLTALPILKGAHDMIAEGIFSSLQDDNLKLKRLVSNLEQFTSHKNYPLLFDPQTAGGLLAGIAKDKADLCLEQLQQAGYSSAVVIGITHANNDLMSSTIKLSG
ncbi:selenide, water dikinase SelD [sulfur-oxidizing endosymbiont of Gigantopelta aegis]|uniref:selenide, water dikinase SelD n=1 Tax=sulfur-oxidizing endosymbiont of Gigantopelta aegis TaxID=2794934 RepID=UPI001FE3500F|nr:selenide, water dikinase SelD [sulfur-oxidizing endosymbiont of Gigantopelta aegis]